MKILNTSVIYENPLPQLKPINSCFPYLCELDDGTILAVHKMGEALESIDGSSWISKSVDGGQTWQSPYRMFDKSKEPVCTSDVCKITKTNNNTLVALGYEFIRSNPNLPVCNPETGGLLNDEVFYSISSDNGLTWSKRHNIKCFWGQHVEASAPITVLQDGSWVSPITIFPGWNGNLTDDIKGRLLRSYDKGKTWTDNVVCMEFEGNKITCYEQRLCQLENGNIVVIGWNEDTSSRKPLNNHYTISFDNGESFSSPIDTGMNGQASSVCAIGNNRLLALHAVRRNSDCPGIYACIVDLSDGNWNIIETKLIWASALPVTKSKNMADIFSFLKFGQPSAIMLKDKNILMCHWICEEGQYKTICTRIKLPEMDPDKLVMKRCAKDNKYLHRDFHIAGDQGIAYVGETYGDDAVTEYLSAFARAYYKPLIEKIKVKGLVALKEHIEETYSKEEASDVLKIELNDNLLSVKIEACPAVLYMKSKGHTPSKWYIETTCTVYKVIATEVGCEFDLLEYDVETGKAHYILKRNGVV